MICNGSEFQVKGFLRVTLEYFFKSHQSLNGTFAELSVLSSSVHVVSIDYSKWGSGLYTCR